MIDHPIRHYVRIDLITQDALEEICRHSLSTKSSVMRRYIQEGALRDVSKYAAQVQATKELIETLRTAD